MPEKPGDVVEGDERFFLDMALPDWIDVFGPMVDGIEPGHCWRYNEARWLLARMRMMWGQMRWCILNWSVDPHVPIQLFRSLTTGMEEVAGSLTIVEAPSYGLKGSAVAMLGAWSAISDGSRCDGTWSWMTGS